VGIGRNILSIGWWCGMVETRQEKDSLGVVEVPAGAMYGAQTQRAVENYRSAECGRRGR
jgi:aspartate ammonia-lyase